MDWDRIRFGTINCRVKLEVADRRESDARILDGRNPASVQAVEVATARLLASPILQEYYAFTVDVLVAYPASFQPVKASDACCRQDAARLLKRLGRKRTLAQ